MENREIKCKYYYKPLNKMFPVTNIDFTYDGSKIIHIHIQPTEEALKEMPGLKFEIEESGDNLVWFIGLHDKNGKEIYEGDIIKKDNDGDGILRVVGYSKYEYVLYEKEQLKSGRRQNGRIFDMSSIIGVAQVYGEVIGNIYENPELLPSNK